MKHLLLLAVMTLFAAIDETTIAEEIFLNEDGSGRYNVYLDQLPALAEMKMHQEGLATIEAAQKAVWKEHSSEFNYSNSVYRDASPTIQQDSELRKLLQHSTYFTIGKKEANTIHSGVMCKFDNLEELALLMELFRDNPLAKVDHKPTATTSFKVTKNNKKELSIEVPTTNASINTTIYLPNKVRKVKGKAKKKNQTVNWNSSEETALTVSWK